MSPTTNTIQDNTTRQVDGDNCDSIYATITWTENLMRGLSNLLLHALLPLNDFGFNYDCLFSDQSACQVMKPLNVLKSSHTKPPQYRQAAGFSQATSQNIPQTKGVGSKYPFFDVDKMKSLYQKILAKSLVANQEKKTRIDSKTTDWLAHKWLITVQLTICTAILSYFLAKDVKRLISVYSRFRLK